MEVIAARHLRRARAKIGLQRPTIVEQARAERVGAGRTLEQLWSELPAEHKHQETRLDPGEHSYEFILANDEHAIDAVVHFFQQAVLVHTTAGDKEVLEMGAALSEALHNALLHGNLEIGSQLRDEDLRRYLRTLRERRKMRAKVDALSMEAKASAVIIGALPLIVMLLVYLTTPDYIKVIFIDPRGHLILGASAVWMTIGILMIRKMINFDI